MLRKTSIKRRINEVCSSREKDLAPRCKCVLQPFFEPFPAQREHITTDAILDTRFEREPRGGAEKYLRQSNPCFCKALEHRDEKEGQRVLDLLFEHSTILAKARRDVNQGAL